jgi:hypothetical protein
MRKIRDDCYISVHLKCGCHCHLLGLVRIAGSAHSRHLLHVLGTRLPKSECLRHLLTNFGTKAFDFFFRFKIFLVERLVKIPEEGISNFSRKL